MQWVAYIYAPKPVVLSPMRSAERGVQETTSPVARFMQQRLEEPKYPRAMPALVAGNSLPEPPRSQGVGSPMPWQQV